MDLILYVPDLCFVFNERPHGVEFLLPPGLESGRIMEDEPWVALEGELITNVMGPSLWRQISVIIGKITELAPSRSGQSVGEKD